MPCLIKKYPYAMFSTLGKKNKISVVVVDKTYLPLILFLTVLMITNKLHIFMLEQYMEALPLAKIFMLDLTLLF